MRCYHYKSAASWLTCGLVLLLCAACGTTPDSSSSPQNPVEQHLPTTSCRVCGWQRSCVELCQAAKEQCVLPWVPAQDDEHACILTWPLTQHPSDAKQTPARAVTANISYRIHKDALSDLIQRYNQVKLVKERGHPVGASWPSSQEQQALRYSLALTYPRLTLMWRVLLGPALAFPSACCHQECFWEEMYRAPGMPSLQDMLSRSAASWKVLLANPNQCRYSSYGASNLGQAMLALWRWTVDQLKHPGASAFALWQRVIVMTPHRVVAEMNCPAMFVAYDAVQAYSDQPLIMMYWVCVALLRTLLDQYYIARVLVRDSRTLADRVMLDVGHTLVCGLIMAMLFGVTAAWLPFLDTIAHQFVLLALPVVHMLLMVASRQLLWTQIGSEQLAHITRQQFEAWLRRQLTSFSVASGLQMPRSQRPHGGGARMTSVGSAGNIADQLLQTGSEDDLLGLEQYLVPSPTVAPAARLLAGTLGTATRPVIVRRLPASYSSVLRPERVQIHRQGAAPAAQSHTPRAGEASFETTRPQGGLASMLDRSPSAPEGTILGSVQHGSEGAGNSMAGLSAAGASQQLLQAALLNALQQQQQLQANATHQPPLVQQQQQQQQMHHGATGISATERAPTQQASLSARQAAAQAAMAAIHWPPPLDLPAWLDDLPSIPHAFRCPITLSLMREPTQASSGVTYERSAIFQWLQLHRVDPVTHAPLKRHRLTPNLNLRHMIEEWAAKQVEPASSVSSDACPAD